MARVFLLFESLRVNIVEEISAFLRSFWDAGILAGERPEEAFLVRCDHTTMTDDDVANRRLIAVCAVALTGPPVTVWLEIRLRSGPPVAAPGGSVDTPRGPAVG